ncbi:unnamed protein product [Schistosoma turkestanicum]|nr:unnamed protein product [Schistosoma turkestanicum]
MAIDNIAPGTGPNRQLFTNNFSNHHHQRKCKNTQTEAHQACMQSIQRIQDQYNLDLNSFNALVDERSFWKWELIDFTAEYIPSFYHQHYYYQSNETVNNLDIDQWNHNNNNYSHLTTIIPSTPYKQTTKFHRYSSTLIFNREDVCYHDQSIYRDPIRVNNQIKSTLSTSRSCNLFTLWQPKIKRERCIEFRKDPSINSRKLLTNELKPDSSSLSNQHRSKSLDSNYSKNHCIPRDQFNQVDKINANHEFSSCIDLYQTDQTDRRKRNKDGNNHSVSKEIDRELKIDQITRKSEQKIKNYHLLYDRLEIKSNTLISTT